jgi:predicted transposase YbfD/YdcC
MLVIEGAIITTDAIGCQRRSRFCARKLFLALRNAPFASARSAAAWRGI